MRGVVTHWANLLDPRGREEEVDWSEFFDRFAKRRPVFVGDREHPGWSPARFDPCERKREHARAVYGACLDYDKGESIEQALTLWQGAYGLLHTSRKHLPDAPRFRVILPWARPVSPFEHEALWIRINAHAGGKLDPAPKDPSRFWFVPGAHDPEFFRAELLTGTPLDPDEWLAKPAPVDRTAPPLAPAPMHDPTAVERRACAYITRMPEAISGSGGHLSTWNVALVLAKGFGLSEGVTLRILESEYNPRCQPPWSRRELEHKARQAAKARVPDGFKLEDDREWQPQRWSLPRPPSEDAVTYEEPPDAHAREPGDDSEETADSETDQRTAWERFGFVSMADLMQMVVLEMRKPRPKAGAATGHHEIDTAIGGFRHGNVTVFGAKRGFGKTSYGNLVADLALRAGRKVALFAGEDAAIMYGKRLLAMRARVNAMMLRDFRCHKEDWPKIIEAIAAAPPEPFFVRVDGRPVEWIAHAISELRKQEPIDLVIVDYLQCLKAKRATQDRRNEVTYVCKTVSEAIKQAGAAGLIFSQLKRTDRVEPEVEDLKESGDIEDMADHILLGWREESRGHPVRRKIKIGKNKDGLDAGELAPVELEFANLTASFNEARDAWGDDFQESA